MAETSLQRPIKFTVKRTAQAHVAVFNQLVAAHLPEAIETK